MTGRKYLVRPGRIHSMNDGQVHFIDARQLMHLHGVEPWECVVIPPGRKLPSGITESQARSMILVTPLYWGSYTDFRRSR